MDSEHTEKLNALAKKVNENSHAIFGVNGKDGLYQKIEEMVATQEKKDLEFKADFEAIKKKQDSTEALHNKFLGVILLGTFLVPIIIKLLSL